ncbi:MAG: hypothetical protein JSR66_02310 [Proteobacteria bacterium]|nr:hypothetical protein [Pseudomonadota bacterium]
MTGFWLPGVVSVAAGMALGWGLQPLNSAAPIGKPSARATGVCEQRAPDKDIDVAAIKAIVRDELASALGRPSQVGALTQPASPRQPVSPQILAQQREAAETIDALIAGGIWGEEQRRAFHQKLLMLDSQQRRHALKQLMTGINSGAIHVTVSGPPL